MRLQPGRSPSPLERAVYQRLVAAGFETAIQVPVGGYRIDLVVSDATQQVAIECDGDRALSLERIPDEMAKQAVLERVGWRFRRIRGTRFYRDPDATMAAVFDELQALGIEPLPGEGEQPSRATPAEDLENRIIRRAWEIMRDEDWVRDSKTPPPPPQPGPVAELVIDDATDPRFVIR
jgi:very-short-patch-repair endonuclease